jgi:hypothetical protein
VCGSPELGTIAAMEIMTREQLYELVWSEPMADLAKRLGISDVGLAKQCRRANVPHPPRGYWAKLDAGKPVERLRLPKESATGATVVAIGNSRLPSTSHLPASEAVRSEPVNPVTDDLPGELEALRDYWRSRLKKVPIPTLARRTHPLIKSLLDRDAERQQRPWPYAQPAALTSRLERRRLRLVNALLLALESAGAVVQIHGDRADELIATVRETRVPFRLDTTGKFRRSTPANRERLVLQLGTSQRPRQDLGEWDEKKQVLDSQLHEIAIAILVAGELLHREYLAERRKLAEEHQRRIEDDARRKREAEEKARQDALVVEAESLFRAQRLRSLVAAAQVAGAGPPTSQGMPLAAWITWASGVADEIDPLGPLRGPAPSQRVGLALTG